MLTSLDELLLFDGLGENPFLKGTATLLEFTKVMLGTTEVLGAMLTLLVV